MAKAKVPGLGKSTGIKPRTFEPYAEGKYLMTVDEVQWISNPEKHYEMLKIKFLIEQTSAENIRDGKAYDVIGKPYFHNLTWLHEDHNSFNEEMNDARTDEYKTLLDLAGVDVPRGDASPHDELVGHSFIAKIKIKKGDPNSDNPYKKEDSNVIYEWESAEEGEE